MSKVTPELFTTLADPQAEAVLTRLYKAALRQTGSLIWHFLPKAHKLPGKGIDWQTEKNEEAFFDDKYIPVHPAQGTFMYMQARAVNARHIFEFGTSYGISAIYPGKAARVKTAEK